MMVPVPLSEDEQRILRQIEQQLEQDPTFAARGYRVPRHRVALLAVGLLAAMTVTVLGLAVSFWFAFAGFLLVLAVAVSLEREVRLLARERLGSLPISAWLGGGRRGNGGGCEPPTERSGSTRAYLPDREVAVDAAARRHRVGGHALHLAAPAVRSGLTVVLGPDQRLDLARRGVGRRRRHRGQRAQRAGGDR